MFNDTYFLIIPYIDFFTVMVYSFMTIKPMKLGTCALVF